MPRKTKREKFAAKAHKSKKLSEVTQVLSPNKIVVAVPTTSVQKIHIEKPKQTSYNPLYETGKKYFIQDLKKSLLIIVCILLFEVALYIGSAHDIFTKFNF